MIGHAKHEIAVTGRRLHGARVRCGPQVDRSWKTWAGRAGISRWAAALLVFAVTPWSTPTRADQSDENKGTAPFLVLGSRGASPESKASGEAPAEPAVVELKPRFELAAPSICKIATEAMRSRTGRLLETMAAIALEGSEGSAEGVDRAELEALFAQMAAWPDTPVQFAIFARDTEGRLRWGLRLNWPIKDLQTRLRELVANPAVAELTKGLALRDVAGGGSELRLGDERLASLVPVGGSQSLIVSHVDLPLRDSNSLDPGSSLVACRLNLAATEKDSGATVFSQFSFVTAINYAASVNGDGLWDELITVDWPPVSGMGAKALIGRVKQTFVAPRDAFGAVAVNVAPPPGMLDGIAGFGPQVMFEESGDISIAGSAEVGPIASHADSEAALAVLPGTGFLPMPDVVMQMRWRQPEHFEMEVGAAADQVNKLYREREQPEPWKREKLRDRMVFWRDSSGPSMGFVTPLSMRTVLFLTKETDAKGKERDFLVLAWTSTSPESLVRRWLEFSRSKDARFIPSDSKSDGEAWINWTLAYRWIAPYIDVALSTASIDQLLPRGAAMNDDLRDATITADVGYAGLKLAHVGPFPLGVPAVPALMGAAVAEDDPAGSDVARERFAVGRLRVLYHHAKLFHKDLGRWPAEVSELDGYVDFAGHPELLRLELSSRKQWMESLKSIFGDPEKKTNEEEDEEEDGAQIDDDLYVIDWGRDRWTLGFKADTFEHLNRLYIDQNGVIHREDRKERREAAASAVQTAQPANGSAPSSKERTP